MMIKENFLSQIKNYQPEYIFSLICPKTERLGYLREMLSENDRDTYLPEWYKMGAYCAQKPIRDKYKMFTYQISSEDLDELIRSI